MTFEELIHQHRGHIAQVVRDLARRHHLAAAERDEFEDAVFHALERNDFELLRAFDGRSSWDTYITLILTREFYAYQAALWGQWRPSAVARRLGPAGILLEELVVRDRLLVSEAIDVMRSSHRVDLPRYRLFHIAQMLGLSDAAPAAASPQADEAEPPESHTHVALQDAIGQLSPDDRLLVALRFRDGQPMTRVASVMQRDVRPVQRRLEQVAWTLRLALRESGVSDAEIDRLLQPPGGVSAHRWWETVLPRPSK
jgi:DNA-directed RNA polymerase specialized sigma24 family protein